VIDFHFFSLAHSAEDTEINSH